MRERLYKDYIIERAAELWSRKLRTPVFDNGDRSINGVLAEGLHSMLLNTQIKDITDINERIDKFRDVLVRKIHEQIESEECFSPWLEVDYNPNRLLSEAAEEAGIPDSMFSIKSHVYLGDDFVQTCWGYGAEQLNHYRLNNGQWLLTNLLGKDIGKVIAEIDKGNTMGFTIE